MQALIVAREKTPVPMEMIPALFDGFRQWRDQHRNRMDYFSFFASGNGGCGIVTIDNEMELHKMVASWPLAPYSDMQVEILVDGDEALQFVNEMIQSQMAQMT